MTTNSIENKLKSLLAGVGLLFLIGCGGSKDISPSLVSKLEDSAKNFRYSNYPYEMSTFYDDGQKIDYHFEKQSESEGKGKHLLIMQKEKEKGAYEIMIDYDKGRITQIKKIKEW